jgi:hypothetical protein
MDVRRITWWLIGPTAPTSTKAEQAVELTSCARRPGLRTPCPADRRPRMRPDDENPVPRP